MGTDGRGVTTLVAFHGCPLRCAYCLNPQCHEPIKRMASTEGLRKVLRKDELYFLATKGGVTFGGGEPYLHAHFIKEVLDNGAKEWHITMETSLNVPLMEVQTLAPYVDEYIVDIKDMNEVTYERYTKKDNALVIGNLHWLVANGYAGKILCRIPLIPNFNDKEAMELSKEMLSDMGITRFNLFTYKTDIKK